MVKYSSLTKKLLLFLLSFHTCSPMHNLNKLFSKYREFEKCFSSFCSHFLSHQIINSHIYLKTEHFYNSILKNRDLVLHSYYIMYYAAQKI